MDRRFLLAIALAVAVLVLNSVLFPPEEKPQAPPPETSREEGTTTQPERKVPALDPPEPVDVPSPEAAPSLSDPEVDAADTEIIHVRTQLSEIELNPIGGTLRSWKLVEYTDASGRPADLVRSPEFGALWFALRTEDRVLRTDSTVFRSSVVRGEGETQVRFTASDPSGITVEKTFAIPQHGYDCRLDVRVTGIGEEVRAGHWEIGWVDGLPILEKEPKQDQMAMAAVALFGKDYVRTGGAAAKFGCAGGGGGRKSETRDGTLAWMGVRNKYFLGALILDEPRDRRVVTAYDSGDWTTSALMSEPLSYSGVTERSYTLYMGPIHYGTLDSYGVGLERVQDLGPGILRPFSKLLMKFFEATSQVIPNYGFLILILSALVRVIFYPLSKKSMQSMKRMQELKPEMDRINEKYKDEPERKNREIMALYQKKKINPLGGCLPLLVQLPVLSGLYYVLSNAVQLRKEPFVLWMNDLSAPDTVANLAGIPLNPLPLIMAGTMVWQQRITPTDPRQKMIAYMMPIMMTFLFYSMSSGLVLYWTVSNLMTVLQQVWMNRDTKKTSKDESEEEEPETRPGPSRKPPRRKKKPKGR
ncbi:MAG: membrane protein insertase YidC [Candidatus Latescibacteria bacterium]|nr:membrane protein insertase YidC [Candidatus Latescibacterota bacterium]